MLQATNYPYYSGSGIGNLGDVCNIYSTDYNPTACDALTGQNNTSWWDSYGGLIVSMIGGLLVKVGDQWQLSASNKQILDAIKASTGGGSGVPSSATIDSLAQQLATARGISFQEAKAILNGTVGGGVPKETTYPSWLLPAGIGLVAFVLLSRRGGA